jgi:VWFA-related protein
MTRRLSLCLLVTAAATAQTPPPATTAPAPAPPVHETMPAQPTTIPTLRANTRLVVVDVVVSDAKGNPVHKLTQSDFMLSEGGKPQTISHFEEHAALSVVDNAKLPPMPHLEPGTFTNYTPAPSDGAINVLLLDALNTPMQDQAFVRQQMLKYLRQPRPGARMAIFGLATQLHMLQGFTSDPDLLRKAIDSKKNLAKGSPLLDDPVSGNTYGVDTLSDQMSDALGNSPGAATVVANIQQFEAEQASFQTMLRAQYTLDAMNALGRYLASIPGRKNLIWFSGSFPINILPDGDLTDPFAAMMSMEDEYRETVNLLARAQVSVYPIDARGLMPLPMFTAANSGAKYAKNPSAMSKDNQKFFTQTAGEHGTMLQMADDTGGKAFINTNGLAEAVQKAVDAGSNYYTLTYTPTNKEWKGDYRKIQVKLEESGYTLAYRKGYYADDPDAPPSKHTPNKSAATAPVTPFDPLHVAMLWGGPDPTQITFAARIVPVTGVPEPTLAEGTRAVPKTSGPYIRYIVQFSADPHAVTATTLPDGKHHIDLEFLTFVYNDQGVLIATTGNRITADIPQGAYLAMMKGGMQYQQEVSVPAKGEYFMRLGVRDSATDHVGALELPVDSVARLKPLSEQAAPAVGAAVKH